MSLQLVLTADTHLPRRARDLPEPLWAAIDAADVVVHAGDWVTVDLLDALETRAARLVGVHGNNDGPARCGPGCRRSRAWTWVVSGSPWSTRPGPPRAGNAGARPRSRTSTSSCSGTATSPGTPPRTGRTAPRCGCSTPARRPTVGGNRPTPG